MGFAVYAPWREECRREAERIFSNNNRSDSNGQYQRVHLQENEDEGGEVTDDLDEAESMSDSGNRLLRSLSSPSFVPANIPDSGKSSGTEESDVDGNTSRRSTSRRVRFKRLAEVVEMNPAEAMAANLARLSYNASLRAQAALQRAAQRLSISSVAKLALFFSFPWFMGNFSYQMALAETEASVVNVLSSSSSLITLLMSAVFPSDSSDKLTLSKLCGVAFSICGVALVSYSDLRIEGDGNVPRGALWGLSGAFCYSVYIVLLKRKVNHEDNMDIPMFFGFVGLFTCVLLWPGILLCHILGNEKFEIPSSKQLEFLLLNGIIGTVLSEILWLWGCFYTSSLIATLAIGLTIPLSIIADIVWRGQTFEPLFLAGVVPMFFSFFVITMLTHYQDWDPVLDLVQYLWRRIRGVVCCQPQRTPASYVFDRQERELLINQETSSSMTESA